MSVSSIFSSVITELIVLGIMALGAFLIQKWLPKHKNVLLYVLGATALMAVILVSGNILVAMHQDSIVPGDDKIIEWLDLPETRAAVPLSNPPDGHQTHITFLYENETVNYVIMKEAPDILNVMVLNPLPRNQTLWWESLNRQQRSNVLYDLQYELGFKPNLALDVRSQSSQVAETTYLMDCSMQVPLAELTKARLLVATKDTIRYARFYRIALNRYYDNVRSRS